MPPPLPVKPPPPYPRHSSPIVFEFFAVVEQGGNGRESSGRGDEEAEPAARAERRHDTGAAGTNTTAERDVTALDRLYYIDQQDHFFFCGMKNREILKFAITCSKNVQGVQFFRVNREGLTDS